MQAMMYLGLILLLAAAVSAVEYGLGSIGPFCRGQAPHLDDAHDVAGDALARRVPQFRGYSAAAYGPGPFPALVGPSGYLTPPSGLTASFQDILEDIVKEGCGSGCAPPTVCPPCRSCDGKQQQRVDLSVTTPDGTTVSFSAGVSGWVIAAIEMLMLISIAAMTYAGKVRWARPTGGLFGGRVWSGRRANGDTPVGQPSSASSSSAAAAAVARLQSRALVTFLPSLTL